MLKGNISAQIMNEIIQYTGKKVESQETSEEKWEKHSPNIIRSLTEIAVNRKATLGDITKVRYLELAAEETLQPQPPKLSTILDTSCMITLLQNARMMRLSY